jgi:hypothetical protein
MKVTIRRLGVLGLCGMMIGCADPANRPAAKDGAAKGDTAAATEKAAMPPATMVSAPTAENNPVNEAAKLEVGQVAPEINGSDLDGVAFKLSDYRGKVVVLDFWGDW